MGGMFGESKFEVLEKVPARYKPITILIPKGSKKDDVVKMIRQANVQFPLIFKPDLGERGFMVTRVHSENEIDEYLSKMKHDFLVQELVDLPLEFGVFYLRFPMEKKGRVTSIVMKEMLAVTGDGRSTLKDLILAKDRAKLQWETLKEIYKHQLHDVLPVGEILQLVSIGNHCLGTKFLDGSHLINDKLSDAFDSISQQIDGFYFGRFDLRCATLDDLNSGKIMVLELNGCGAEPAHIYHPGYSLVKAIKVLLDHWKNIFIIAQQNAKQGIPFVPFRDARRYYKKFKEATQLT
jgi:hypothetical protein